MGGATDTLMVIRCPYCLTGIDFGPMIAYINGRFVCRDYAHTVRPGMSEYGCTCRTCLRLMWKRLGVGNEAHHGLELIDPLIGED